MSEAEVQPVPTVPKACACCGKRFECAEGGSGCWCESVVLSREALSELRSLADDCLCPACLGEFAERNRRDPDRGRVEPRVQPPEPPPPEKRPRSLVLVNTGDGKGKSTAAFGVVLRALAREWRVCVIQFIKSDKWKVGEEKIAVQLGVDWLKGGDGFSWESPDLDKSEGRAVAAWQLAAAAIAGGEYQLVVLDEITYPMNWGWINGAEVVDAIRARPAHVNVVATGRDAPEELIGLADTVTEMVKIKHAYDRGIRARRGIDF